MWRTLDKKSNRYPQHVNYAVLVSKHLNKGKQRGQIAITLSEQFLKLLGWKVGDTVCWMIDDDRGAIALKQSPDGRKLSYAGKGSKASAVTKAVLGEDDERKVIDGQPRYLKASDLVMFDRQMVVIPFVAEKTSDAS